MTTEIINTDEITDANQQAALMMVSHMRLDEVLAGHQTCGDHLE